jgi:glycerophosphoryl diester phosphodiesterase
LTPLDGPHSFAIIVPQNYYREARLTHRSHPHGPERISHRGAHDTLPENTIPAFLKALELGADAIELDVHATSDGVVVIHHDPTVERGRGMARTLAAISDLTSSEIRKVLLADGIGIPTLADVLDAVGDGPRVYVEIKGTNIEPLVVRCIRESTANCAIHSFDHRIVQNVKKIFPALRTGVLEVARHLDPLATLVETGAEDLWQDWTLIDEDLVRRVHAGNCRVIAWTSNDPVEWKTLLALGVDGICTDRIGELAAFAW